MNSQVSLDKLLKLKTELRTNFRNKNNVNQEGKCEIPVIEDKSLEISLFSDLARGYHTDGI